jgi:hypothetical protein
MWVNLAATNHPIPEMKENLIKQRGLIISMMTPAQVAEGQRTSDGT